MPYITEKDRSDIDCYVDILSPSTPEQLNYAITRMVNNYFIDFGGVSYLRYNEVIGVLECAKMELYRRIAAPHEDQKIESNGDAYTCQK